MSILPIKGFGLNLKKKKKKVRAMGGWAHLRRRKAHLHLGI